MAADSRIRLHPQDLSSPEAAATGTLEIAADSGTMEPGWVDDAAVFHTFVGPEGPEGPEGPPGEGVPPTVVAHGAMGAAETFDYGDGPAHSAEADAACTWTFTGATAGEVIMTVYLEVDSGGPWAITLPASVSNKTEAEAFLASIAASTTAIIPFVTIDGGTAWTAMLDEAGAASDLDAIIAASSGQDIADALAGAAAPDSGNVFATMADVGGGGALVVVETPLASDVGVPTAGTWVDVVSESLAAGSYKIEAKVVWSTSIANTDACYVRLLSGATVIDEGETDVLANAGQYLTIPLLAGALVLGSTTTVKVQITGARNGTITARADISGNSASTAKATKMVTTKYA